jgi:hypothetical protein
MEGAPSPAQQIYSGSAGDTMFAATCDVVTGILASITAESKEYAVELANVTASRC